METPQTTSLDLKRKYTEERKDLARRQETNMDLVASGYHDGLRKGTIKTLETVEKVLGKDARDRVERAMYC